MLVVISASRFEPLQQHLLEGLMQAGGDPFALESVVVPSAAVRRRLTLATADRHGICSLVEFPFLAAWLWRQLARVLPGVAEDSPYDPALLRWRIEAGLADKALLDAHPRLADWLAEADPAMRFGLAERLAGLFAQYLTWRPDWLAAWQAGAVRATAASEPVARQDELWQAALWRRLQREIAPSGAAEHPVAVFLARIAAAAPGDPALQALPARARVFCPPAMPPLYLELLCGLARHVTLELYVLDPCREFWFDLASAREHARRSLRGDAQHLEVGHRLLSGWGRQTQSWLAMLHEREEVQQVLDLDQRDGGPPAAVSLLAQLQDGIRTLSDPAPGTLASRAAPDGSLEIHVCHSLLRELEVLHDRLLGWFGGPHPPLAGDILVVVPDLARAAPLIAQVFGTAARDLAIPWTISGLARTASDPLARALLALLDLARGRMTLSALLAVLQEAPVAECFGIDEAAHQQLALLLQDAGVHWGLDAGQRAACGVPAGARGTLADGLERLWLAYALPEGQALVWQAHLPGSAVAPPAELLGALHAFRERLAELRVRLAEALTPQRWQATLEWCLAAFTPAGRAWRQAQGELIGELQSQFAELRAAGVDRALPVEVLVASLRGHLAGAAGGGVAGGAVSFAAMPSLRLLPARYLCVLGLDDGVFPGPQRPLEFDLMASHPRRGDRQRGDDERNLFLDLLLAARDGLHLSYSGRSARDNGVRPPSVLLAELIDAVVPALCPADASADQLASMQARLVCQHPLQPFDPDYFRPAGRLPRSHRRDLAAALRSRAEPAGVPDTPFFPTPLAPLDPAWRALGLERLSGFLMHPARALLRDRLGLRLAWAGEQWSDEEDFLPARGAQRRLAAHLLPVLLEHPDRSDESLLALAAAGAAFPDGPLGLAALRDELVVLRDFARDAAALQSATAQPRRSASLVLALADGDWQLHGTLDAGAADGARQCGWEYADLDIRRELAVWLRHLWACAQMTGGAGVQTVWRLRDTRLAFAALPADQARAHLGVLLGLYARGMCAPLHFFPRSAAALLEEGAGAAHRCWHGAVSGQLQLAGERDDPAWQVALRGVAEPLDADFEQLAVQVLGPMREARA